MKKFIMITMVLLACGVAFTDTFGTGANEFDIDFVDISGDTNLSTGYGIVNDYRMGKFEVTNDQWNKFQASYDAVTGSQSDAYDQGSYFSGSNVPTSNVSWYEAAQFVNHLNTSTGHHAAYNFTGTQGTSNYTFDTWSTAEAVGGANNYRHKDAFYFLPTEYEWAKAAYWNGTRLQTYSSVGDVTPTQSGWNYYNDGFATNPAGPWDVGSGSEEINGTFDMMGNLWEWNESDIFTSSRGFRGGTFGNNISFLSSYNRTGDVPYKENNRFGFRVASVPEPATLLLLGLGGLALRKRRA